MVLLLYGLSLIKNLQLTEIFNQDIISAAHKTLPLPSMKGYKFNNKKYLFAS